MRRRVASPRRGREGGARAPGPRAHVRHADPRDAQDPRRGEAVRFLSVAAGRLRLGGDPSLCLWLVLAAAACGSGDVDSELGDTAQDVTICADGTTIDGIDVSGHQPHTDWTQVKQDGQAFAIVKATEGTHHDN